MPSTSLRVLSSKTFRCSWSKTDISAKSRLATSWGELMTARSWGARETNRRPNSNAAMSWLDLASLRPRSAHNSAKLTRPNPARPSKRASRREETAKTFSPGKPVRNRMAMSSVLLKDLGPNARSRSRGRSPWGRSRIVGWY